MAVTLVGTANIYNIHSLHYFFFILHVSGKECSVQHAYVRILRCAVYRGAESATVSKYQNDRSHSKQNTCVVVIQPTQSRSLQPVADNVVIVLLLEADNISHEY